MANEQGFWENIWDTAWKNTEGEDFAERNSGRSIAEGTYEYLQKVANDDVISNIVNSSGASQLSMMCFSVAGLFMLIAIVQTGYELVVKQKQTVMSLVKKMAVPIILLTLYVPCMSILNTTLSIFTDMTASIKFRERDPKEYAMEQARKRGIHLMEIQNQNNVKEGDLTLGQASVNDEKHFDEFGIIELEPTAWNVTSNIKKFVIDIFQDICILIGAIFKILLLILRMAALIVLYIVGPLAIAMSVLPKFEDRAFDWFKAYCTIYLWRAVANIIDYLIFSIGDMMMLNTHESAGWVHYISMFALGLSYILVPETTRLLTGSSYSQTIERMFSQLSAGLIQQVISIGTSSMVSNGMSSLSSLGKMGKKSLGQDEFVAGSKKSNQRNDI